ncbi:MAG: hypothetical protein H6608_08465 [Flavobacteriales bacterium]|nr:hypothetical protein [Bacteroidota bacterium]MCB9241151.1 hypothetical protein [Flavobacteriales bacterium]
MAQNATFKKSKVELRMGAGASMFFGDLGGNFKSRKDGFLDIDMRSVRGNFNLSAKYNIYKWLAIRTDFNQAQVVGDDAFSAEYFRRNRNLSFSSSISELSLTGELVAVNLLRWRQLSKLHFELYGFGGLGVFRFNPKATLNNRVYELQPMGTEGQGLIPGSKPYSLISGVLPLGIGLRKLVGNTVMVGVELSLRKSFTDYIDDVSGTYYANNVIREVRGDVAADLADRSLNGSGAAGTPRGNPGENDNYSFIQIYFQKGLSNQLIRDERQAFRKITNKMHKCPKFR